MPLSQTTTFRLSMAPRCGSAEDGSGYDFRRRIWWRWLEVKGSTEASMNKEAFLFSF